MINNSLSTLTPLVGYHVDEITPLEKSEDLNQQETHYLLLDRGLENELGNILNFKELKKDQAFLNARKYINKKDYISTKTYENVCEKIADNMKISHGKVDRNQKMTQALSNLVNKNKKSGIKFDKNK